MFGPLRPQEIKDLVIAKYREVVFALIIKFINKYKLIHLLLWSGCQFSLLSVSNNFTFKNLVNNFPHLILFLLLVTFLDKNVLILWREIHLLSPRVVLSLLDGIKFHPAFCQVSQTIHWQTFLFFALVVEMKDHLLSIE